MKIILVYGLKNAGKDTVANIILKQKKGAIKMSFADALKHVIYDISRLLCPDSGVTMDILYSDLKNTHQVSGGVTVRTALQVIGTDILRKHLHDDVFVDNIIHKIHSSADTDFIVIPDLRFPNELTRVHAAFPGMCRVIHVTRDIMTPDSHVSENLQDAIAETVTALSIPSDHFHSDTFDNWDAMISTILDPLVVSNTIEPL